MADPTTVSGLRGRWRASTISGSPADASLVTSWTDTAGTAHATSSGANRPTYRSSGAFLPNSKPVVEFVSTGPNKVTATLSQSGATTRFVVCRFKTLSALGTLASSPLQMVVGSDGKFRTAVENVTWLVETSGLATLTTNTWYVLTMADNGSTGHTTYVNGTQDGTSSTSHTNSGTALVIGTKYSDPTEPLNAYVAEVLDYSTVLSAGDRATVHTYLSDEYGITVTDYLGPIVSRVAVTTGAPGAATAFTPTLPTHATGDRLILAVVGKYETTTIPTINQSWTLLKSGTGGTGSAANDTGQTFWAVYGIDATSASMTAPTVTPGGTAPNSWEWICASYRPFTGFWADPIGTSATWVQSASDTNTASPLTGTAGAFTDQPTTGDAIFAVGVVPTDLGTALGATTLTATGLSGGTVTAATTQYIENALGQDTAAVWADWTNFTGTASAGVAASFTVTGATTQSGSIVAVALRQSSGAVAPKRRIGKRTF